MASHVNVPVLGVGQIQVTTFKKVEMAKTFGHIVSLLFY